MNVDTTGKIIRHYSIETPSELEMAVFCIEELARRANITGDKTYRALTKVLPNKLTVLAGYIIPLTEFFRTQGENYILAEILYTMDEWGCHCVFLLSGNNARCNEMTDAESYILQQRYVDTVIKFGTLANFSLNEAFHKFYQSEFYQNVIHLTAQEILNIPEENMIAELLREYSIKTLSPITSSRI